VIDEPKIEEIESFKKFNTTYYNPFQNVWSYYSNTSRAFITKRELEENITRSLLKKLSLTLVLTCTCTYTSRLSLLHCYGAIVVLAFIHCCRGAAALGWPVASSPPMPQRGTILGRSDPHQNQAITTAARRLTFFRTWTSSVASGYSIFIRARTN